MVGRVSDWLEAHRQFETRRDSRGLEHSSKGIVKRKMSGGSMSKDGAIAYACIQSIAMTCHLRNMSFHGFLKASLVQYIRTGKPMLLAEYENGGTEVIEKMAA